MPIPVLFCCSGCQTVYQAFQTRAAANGAFTCDECSTVVYRWFPPYEYVEWKRTEGSSAAV